MFDVREIAQLSRAEGEERIRALCQSQYLGGRRLVGRCLGRYKMFLDGDDVSFAPHILLDGFWEYWITQFVVATVRPGMTVIDVGANFGYYSLLFADLVGPSGGVFAVEPNPRAAAFLRDTLMVNGFGGYARVEQAALGCLSDGEALFHLRKDAPLNSRVVQSEIAADESSCTIRVRATTIDKLAADLKQLDFIKVDAEGGEADILDGMTETVKRLKPTLLLEFNAARDYDAAAFLNKLGSLFRDVSYVDFDGRRKATTTQELLTQNVGQDWMLYCSHEHRALSEYKRFFVDQGRWRRGS